MWMNNQNDMIKKRLRKRRRFAFTTLIFVTIFLLWGIYNMIQSDLFYLKVTEVKDNDLLSEEEVIKQSKLEKNRNIFKYNLDDIKSNLLSHPYIKEAHIKIKIPHTMIIHVKERDEYAIIRYIDSYIYIDQETVILKVVDISQPRDLMMITGVEFESFMVGEYIHANNHQMLSIALDLVEAAKIVSIHEKISEINISDDANVKIYTENGYEVLLGRGTNPAYIVLALKEILESLEARSMKDVVIDMRNEGQISVYNRVQ